MSTQFSVWLDDQTAQDLEVLSRSEERKRGAMIKVLIRRAARELTQADTGPDELVATGVPGQEQLALGSRRLNLSRRRSSSGDGKKV